MLNVPPDADALPPVLDVEWNSHSKTCPGRVSRELALAKMKTMLDAMQAHTGKRPIIYTDPAFHRDVLAGEFAEYHFWLRSVAAQPHKNYGKRRWAFWQFTTDRPRAGRQRQGRSQRLQRHGEGLGPRAEMADVEPLAHVNYG